MLFVISRWNMTTLWAQIALSLCGFTSSTEGFAPRISRNNYCRHNVNIVGVLSVSDMNVEEDLFALWEEELEQEEEENDHRFIPSTGTSLGNRVNHSALHRTSISQEEDSKTNQMIDSFYQQKRNGGMQPFWNQEDESLITRDGDIASTVRATRQSDLQKNSTMDEGIRYKEIELHALWDSDESDDDYDNDDFLDQRLVESSVEVTSPSLVRTSSIENTTKSDQEKGTFLPKPMPEAESMGIDHNDRLSKQQLPHHMNCERSKVNRLKVKEAKIAAQATRMTLDTLALILRPSKRRSPKEFQKFYRLYKVHFRLLKELEELEGEAKKRATEFVIKRVAHQASLGDNDSTSRLQTIESIRDEEIKRRDKLFDLALRRDKPDGLELLTIEEIRRILRIRGNVKKVLKRMKPETFLSKLQESYRADLF